jgi:hypothetical protein
MNTTTEPTRQQKAALTRKLNAEKKKAEELANTLVATQPAPVVVVAPKPAPKLVIQDEEEDEGSDDDDEASETQSQSSEESADEDEEVSDSDDEEKLAEAKALLERAEKKKAEKEQAKAKTTWLKTNAITETQLWVKEQQELLVKLAKQHGIPETIYNLGATYEWEKIEYDEDNDFMGDDADEYKVFAERVWEIKNSKPVPVKKATQPKTKSAGGEKKEKKPKQPKGEFVPHTFGDRVRRIAPNKIEVLKHLTFGYEGKKVKIGENAFSTNELQDLMDKNPPVKKLFQDICENSERRQRKRPSEETIAKFLASI